MRSIRNRSRLHRRCALSRNMQEWRGCGDYNVAGGYHKALSLECWQVTKVAYSLYHMYRVVPTADAYSLRRVFLYAMVFVQLLHVW